MTRAAILAFSVALHAVLVYLALTARIDIKILKFNEKTTTVILVPRPPIRFTASPHAGEALPAAVEPAGAAAPQPGMAPRERVGGEEGLPAGSGGGGGVSGGTGAPPGGSAGEMIGGAGRGGEAGLTSGFSLVYPADAMLNLSKYAREPEDAWLQPLREAAKSRGSFSRYLHPSPGSAEAAVAGSGGPGIAGGTNTLKPPPAGVVAAFVPENVKTFDLSGWAGGVLNAVQKNWTLGGEAWTAEWIGRVTVTVLVMKDGLLNAVEVAASSGLSLLDASALRAIEQSGPWPALPDGFPGSSLEIQLVFQYGL